MTKTSVRKITSDSMWEVPEASRADGQAHDGRQFEALDESLAPDNVLEFAALDKGYDAERIRERLALDGSAAVTPAFHYPRQKLPYDKELSRGRNRIEHFFNKLKPLRRLATRDDKLAKTFLAAVCLVAKNS